MKLSGRVAVVTGASSGMGQDAAKGLARDGAKVVLVGRSAEKLNKTLEAIQKDGGEGTIFQTDISTESGNKNLFDFARDTYGAVHIVFLNAGVFATHKLEDHTEEILDGMINTNVKSIFFALKYVLPIMRETAEEKGSIIINSSAMSTGVSVSMGPASLYAATKAAAKMITKYAAMEAAPNVRVNAIAPGIVRTPIFPNADNKGELDGFAGQVQLVGRAGEVGEITPLVQYLASDDSSFVTGSELLIDGGWSIKA